MPQKKEMGRKDEICRRVKETRVQVFGNGHGAQKEMAKTLGIPYTTYRGYEENRTNDEFLIRFSKKYGVPLLWLLCVEKATTSPIIPAPGLKQNLIVIDPEKGILEHGIFNFVQATEDDMAPLIQKGAWIGTLPIKSGEDVNGKLIAFRDNSGQVHVRRAYYREGGSLIGVAINPQIEPIQIKKRKILGEAKYQFGPLP